MASHRVFIDFDNTITVGDVLDGVIAAFSPDERWQDLEQAWQKGKIGARACLDGQMRGLRVAWPDLARHLDQVTIDPGFARLVEVLRRKRVEMTILTDNFDLLVEHILERHGLGGLSYRANHLELDGERFIPSFPYVNPACPDCAHCKKIHFLPHNDDARRVVYIGDGRSDLCPAREADLVYAKSGLLNALHQEGIECVAFDGLARVAESLENLLHENHVRCRARAGIA